jgi:hypothetical protein
LSSSCSKIIILCTNIWWSEKTYVLKHFFLIIIYYLLLSSNSTCSQSFWRLASVKSYLLFLSLYLCFLLVLANDNILFIFSYRNKTYIFFFLFPKYKKSNWLFIYFVIRIFSLYLHIYKYANRIACLYHLKYYNTGPNATLIDIEQNNV